MHRMCKEMAAPLSGQAPKAQEGHARAAAEGATSHCHSGVALRTSDGLETHSGFSPETLILSLVLVVKIVQDSPSIIFSSLPTNGFSSFPV